MEVDFDTKTQHGRNLQVVMDRTTGGNTNVRDQQKGLYLLPALIGLRDKGDLVITAYRICHKARDNPGTYTVYTREYLAMREEGIDRPTPGKQILKDIQELIQ